MKLLKNKAESRPGENGSRRRVESNTEAPGAHDESNWLVSYADMMTVLCCFFILLVSMANFDVKEFEHLAKRISEHFSHGKEKDMGGTGPYFMNDQKMKYMQQELAQHPEIKKLAKISVSEGALMVTFTGSVLFQSGSAKLQEEVLPVLDAMIDIFKNKDPDLRIVVEGHADNRPMDPNSAFANNWALSGARAGAVVYRFENYGFIPSHLRAVGFGDTKPLVPNDDKDGKPIPENQNINRRVVIKVIGPNQLLEKQAKIKMGLNIYFSDQDLEEESKGAK